MLSLVPLFAAAMIFQAARAPHALSLDPSLADPAWKLGAIAPDGFWNVTKRSPADLKTQVYLLGCFDVKLVGEACLLILHDFKPLE